MFMESERFWDCLLGIIIDLGRCFLVIFLIIGVVVVFFLIHDFLLKRYPNWGLAIFIIIVCCAGIALAYILD